MVLCIKLPESFELLAGAEGCAETEIDDLADPTGVQLEKRSAPRSLSGIDTDVGRERERERERDVDHNNNNRKGSLTRQFSSLISRWTTLFAWQMWIPHAI